MAHFNTGRAKSRYTVIILFTILYCIPTFGPPCIFQDSPGHDERKKRNIGIRTAAKQSSEYTRNCNRYTSLLVVKEGSVWMVQGDTVRLVPSG